MDRITFQNQIWIFNEMSSLMKTFYNNRLFHRFRRENISEEDVNTPVDIRFTKILTKYSTEYSNWMFLYSLCQELDMDKKDTAAFFQELRLYYGAEFMNRAETLNDSEKIFNDTKIKKLDIKRMYRYLDKNVKKELVGGKDGEDDEDDDEDEYDLL